MKIKDIKQYRSFYKTTRPVSPALEEDFIGNYYIEEATSNKGFGWFTMYHGDRDGFSTPEAGIENFLQSFLDMAKDGQAVYEFLQNAVDAGSTHYTMVWGKDEVDGNYYLLVANNGEMFTPNSIRSILNVGSSTKNADSRTIGKFGIGFKLAHRLVGKDNGLQELINESSGPLLFSWKNYELEKLAKGYDPKPTEINISKNDKGEISIQDETPWLFKILITCFPCLPENSLVQELPKMVNGVKATSTPFSKAEYQVLSRWVRKNSHILNKETYNEGALFFIKLGAGKETELEEINLKAGVKFALAILKETAEEETKKDKILHTVQLNDEEPITYPELEYIKLSVDRHKEKDTYAYIRFGIQSYDELTGEQKKRIAHEANIEALFGFRKHNEIGDYFRGAPNLYLYFPLSEEVHNFNYILHSNAFYKGSSRTFLHKGSSKEDGINERLLKVIVEKIDSELSRLSSSADIKDRELFLHFYAALLTSGSSLNQDRKWIEDPYINRIDEVIKKYIPVRKSYNSSDFTVISSSDNLFIKKTKVEIDTSNWGLNNVNWFYWGEDAEGSILQKAAYKLGVKEYTIYNLLTANDTICTQLDQWINNNDSNIRNVLLEIAGLDGEVMKNTTFRKNFFNTSLLRFNNEELLSIDRFQEKEQDGYFIVFNKLHDIKDLLQKLCLYFTKENFDDYNFNPKFFSFFASESQVKSYTILTKLFSQVVTIEKLATLSPGEKHRIFEAFRTLNDTPGERMGELKLFKNNSNIPVCLKNLYSSSRSGWLSKFSIHNSEDNPAYRSYLINKPEALYQGIIFPFWDQIASYIAANPANAKETLEDLVNAYEKSNWVEKANFLFHTQNLILFQSEVVEVNEIYYSKELEALTDVNFKRIQAVVLKYFDVHIPDKCMLPYMDRQPFSFASCSIDPVVEDVESSQYEINDLLLFCKLCNIDFFGSNCITQENGVYQMNSSSGKKQISTTKQEVVSYIRTYHPNDFVLIPDSFTSFRSKIELSDSKLIEQLIEIFVEDESLDQELDLVAIVLAERYDDKKLLLDKLTYTFLDASWNEERQNALYIKLLKEVVEGGISVEELAQIHSKVIINVNEQQIKIEEIDSAHDSIEVQRVDKKVVLSQSQILNLENADSIKLIQAFHDEAKRRDLIGQGSADKLFKISNVGITDELVSRFSSRLEDKNLVNSHQLLFVLLSGKFAKEEFESFSLKSYNGEWYTLEKQLIIYSEENEKYINHINLLDSCYGDLQSLMHLSDLEAYYYGENDEDLIASRFLFVRGCNPDILESKEDIKCRLDYLYRGWISLSTHLKDYKRNQDWESYLGVEPKGYILNGIHLEKEILPSEFLTWHNKEKKKEELFRAFGVYINDSPIEKLRKYLLGDIEVLPDDLDFSRFNNAILLNTLNGVAGEFSHLKGKPVIYAASENEQHIGLIERIINHLYTSDSNEYSTLVYETAESFKVLNSENNELFKLDEELHDKLKACEENYLYLLYQTYNILRISPSLNEEIIDACEELELGKTFVITDNRVEHDEPFYNSWKEENKVRIFRVDELLYDVAMFMDQVEVHLGRISEGDFFVKEEDDDDCQEIYYLKNTSLEELASSLEEDYEELSEAVNDLVRRRNVMLASFYNTLNAAGKGEVNSAHLEALQTAFKEENLKQERKELIENIKSSEDYSYDWFESYLKFLLTFENKQDTTRQKSISFQQIKRYSIDGEISNKYFLLCGASSLIPLNIEEFEDFKISLVLKERQNENIKVEGVSKKGQDLLIYCREAIPQAVINLFKDVIQVKISFSPVIDLLRRLFDAFTNRHYLDIWDDVQEVLPGIHFIYGPPGTGKTTTLCSMIIDGVKEKYNAKYLLLTPTNKAADVLCKKLVKPSDKPSDIIRQKLNELARTGKSISIARIGRPTDPELEALDEEIYTDSLNMDRLDYAHIVASTIHRLPYFEILDEDSTSDPRMFELQDYWDYVIFDEASMINLPYLVFAILAIHKCNPNVKFIVAGDPKQIPPVIDVNDKDLEELDIQDENVYTMMEISSFKPSAQLFRPRDQITNLETQYRSVKQIGELFSTLSYGGLLKHDREKKNEKAKPLPAAFTRLINKNVTFVDIPLSQENSIFRINKLLYSSYHIYSAIFVAELIKYLDSLLKENDSWSIGLIAPYKAQSILLNKLVTSYGISERLKIYSDTVHGFQGDECDIVFFISNPNNYYYSGHPKCLLSKEYIYNVAISRAKDYLIILHPETIQNPYINSLKYSYSRHFENPVIRKSSEFEKYLFDQKDYIEKNSYITGHDNVNVFGQIEMKYFIKANDSAIDIQLRKFDR